MNTALLDERIAKLKHRTDGNAAAAEALRDWLLQSEALQRIRINPYAAASHSGLGLEGVLPEFLHGVPLDLFDMHWDIHCPHCNMIAAEFNNLADATEIYACPMCEVDFEADFSVHIEVTFSLNREIEDLRLPPVCSPPEALQLKCRLAARCGETVSALATLEPGRYRYYCPATRAKGILLVEGPPAEDLQPISIQQLEGSRYAPHALTVRPGPVRIELLNRGHPICGLYIHADELTAELPLERLPSRLSGLQVIHFPDYRRLFGDQVLSAHERMILRSVTVMFTDIIGSTSMYEKLGDAKAYNIVRSHFRVLFRAVEDSGGTVIKTIGDSVMASFLSNEQALRAVVNALQGFEAYNQGHHEDEQIEIRIGIHRGPALLVNLNGRLDYFGTTINKAARLHEAGRRGDVTFSGEVYDDASFLRALRNRGATDVTQRSERLKGFHEEQAIYSARLWKQ